jgi:hypothetical protein
MLANNLSLDEEDEVQDELRVLEEQAVRGSAFGRSASANQCTKLLAEKQKQAEERAGEQIELPKVPETVPVPAEQRPSTPKEPERARIAVPA